MAGLGVRVHPARVCVGAGVRGQRCLCVLPRAGFQGCVSMGCALWARAVGVSAHLQLASGEWQGSREICVCNPRPCVCSAPALLSLPWSTWRCAARDPSEPTPALPEPCPGSPSCCPSPCPFRELRTGAPIPPQALALPFVRRGLTLGWKQIKVVGRGGFSGTCGARAMAARG